MIREDRTGSASLGFTLVELLVALTISTIVILAAFGASRSGWQLWRRVEDRRPMEQAASRIIGMMRTEWLGLYWPVAGEGGDAPFVRLEGKGGGEQKVSFCTTMPSYYRGLPPGRCARVTYEFRANPSAEMASGVLIRREQLLAGELPIAEPIVDVVVAGLETFTLEFFDKNGRLYQVGGGQLNVPPRVVTLTMSWRAPNTAEKKVEPVVYMAQFLVPSEASLMPSTLGQNTGT